MMPLSRRRFLGMAASLPLASLSHRFAAEAPIPPDDRARPSCLLLDAGERCVLQESLTGFARGLAAASIPFERVDWKTAQSARPIIIPGAVMDSFELAETLHRAADSGSTVLYESGAGYAEPDAFEAEQRLLRDYFGLSVQAPRGLWQTNPETGRPPYVRYHWPALAMIRDFSRVIGVGEAASSAHIAHVGKTAVAYHSPIGKGKFIYLGSPLGPHLGFGDAQAQRLLEAFAVPNARAEVHPPFRNQPAIRDRPTYSV